MLEIFQKKKNSILKNYKIDQIENDPNNIVWYVRNYYADQFKLKLYTMRRRALVNHFLSEQLIKRNKTEFANNPEALNKELTAQIHEIYKKENGKYILLK